jgi:FAD/FMN-containing dehydrogenase
MAAMPSKIKKILGRLALVLGLLALALIGPPSLFLANVWWHDCDFPLTLGPPGTTDASRLSSNTPAEVIAVPADPALAERQLAALVRRASAEKLKISVSGARHSMGGHTFYPGGIVLDTLPLDHMALDEKTRLLTVGAGARWSEIIPYLDRHGMAVAVMQAYDDFTVGGSLSVNGHGWQNDRPPLAATVESFRLLTAGGEVVRCSRTENSELFSLALGGYGLFGVILDATLRVVPNETYVAEAHRVKPADYGRRYEELTHGRDDVGMAYGRISVAPDSFLEDGILTVLRRVPGSTPGTAGTLAAEPPPLLNRLVFRGSVGSDYGKNLRWRLETMIGEKRGRVLSRNQVMHQSSSLYANRHPAATEILHEYFIPAARLEEFVAKARPVLLRHEADLLNITVRNVMADEDTVLRYAPEEVFGLVLLFDQCRDPAADAAMQALTRELIDVALDCGGRYYLPYRPHATAEQFRRSYPEATEFFARKRRYDPDGIFSNNFYSNYGKAFEPAAGRPPGG